MYDGSRSKLLIYRSAWCLLSSTTTNASTRSTTMSTQSWLGSVPCWWQSIIIHRLIIIITEADTMRSLNCQQSCWTNTIIAICPHILLYPITRLFDLADSAVSGWIKTTTCVVGLSVLVAKWWSTTSVICNQQQLSPACKVWRSGLPQQKEQRSVPTQV